MSQIAARKPAGVIAHQAKNAAKKAFTPKNMDPAEVRLELQVLLGGLIFSGLTLFIVELLSR